MEPTSYSVLLRMITRLSPTTLDELVRAFEVALQERRRDELERVLESR